MRNVKILYKSAIIVLGIFLYVLSICIRMQILTCIVWSATAAEQDKIYYKDDTDGRVQDRIETYVNNAQEKEYKFVNRSYKITYDENQEYFAYEYNDDEGKIIIENNYWLKNGK